MVLKYASQYVDRQISPRQDEEDEHEPGGREQRFPGHWVRSDAVLRDPSVPLPALQKGIFSLFNYSRPDIYTIFV